MFNRINNYHAMTNSSSQFLFISTSKLHICNKIWNDAHLLLFIFFTHDFHTLFIRICSLGIKIFKTIQSFCRFNTNFIISRYSYYKIAIEISSRKSLGNVWINSDSIGHVAENIFCLLILIINRKNRNLESSGMRISYKSYLLTIVVVWSIYFIIFHGVGRQNNLYSLPW